MRGHLAIGSLGLIAAAAGCITSSGSEPSGNTALGIVTFQVSETAERTTVLGLDAESKPIAKLDLIHGYFALGDEYAELAGTVSDGRKLSVEVREQAITWETIGYSDTTEMPALPGELSSIAAFVNDEHVRPLLEKWKIGWSEERATGEVAYFEDGTCGSNRTECTGTCPILGNTSTTPTCNGGTTLDAYSVDQGQESSVMQCCDTALALKTCAPANYNNCSGSSHHCSACGDSGSNQCKPCYGIAYSQFCVLSTVGSDCVDGHTWEADGHPCSNPGDCWSNVCNGNGLCGCSPTYGSCTSSGDCCSGTCMENICWG